MLRKNKTVAERKRFARTDSLTTSDHNDKSAASSIPLGADDSTFATPKRTKSNDGDFFPYMSVVKLFKSGNGVPKKSESTVAVAYRAEHSKCSKKYVLFAISVLVLVAIVHNSQHSNVIPKETKHRAPYFIYQTPHFLLARSTARRPARVMDMPVVFKYLLGHPENFHVIRFKYPSELQRDEEADSDDPRDFGGLSFKLLEEGEHRQIYHAMNEMKKFRSEDDAGSPDPDRYFAFDDDYKRNSYHDFDDDTLMDTHRCRRPSFYRYQFPTCNDVHELAMDAVIPKLVAHGAWRQVFLFGKDTYPVASKENLVVKKLGYDRDVEYTAMETIRMDALVSERLTSRSNIVDIYGFCGITILSEAFVNGDIEEDVLGISDRDVGFHPLADPKVKPYNNFTPSQKLKLALAMTEPLAELHNYPGGIIVYDDLDLGQYLWTDETKTTVKLNDFNRAEIMLYDEEHQQYCKYKNGIGGGDWRAPEEFSDHPLNNKIDIFSLGNNFFSLLTGYKPLVDVDDRHWDRIQYDVRHGHFAKIDPRFRTNSYAEGKLVQAIELCYVVDPDERADINEIIEFLREAIVEDERRQSLSQNSHITSDMRNVEQEKI